MPKVSMDIEKMSKNKLLEYIEEMHIQHQRLMNDNAELWLELKAFNSKNDRSYLCATIDDLCSIKEELDVVMDKVGCDDVDELFGCIRGKLYSALVNVLQTCYLERL